MMWGMPVAHDTQICRRMWRRLMARRWKFKGKSTARVAARTEAPPWSVADEPNERLRSRAVRAERRFGPTLRFIVVGQLTGYRHRPDALMLDYRQ
jgi:hypothetical protein